MAHVRASSTLLKVVAFAIGKATGGSAGATDLIAFGHHIECGPRQSGLPTQRI